MRLALVAHNIRSLWNIGSLFRTADCFGVDKLYLTGYTAVPPRREISKTALGTEEWITWEQRADSKQLLEELKNDGWRVVALEITEDATSLPTYKATQDTVLVLGHEVTGVAPELLPLCDETVHIPMFGKKESLNVSVAAGIALYQMRACSRSVS